MTKNSKDEIGLYYWENQLILYTKGHYGHINYENDLRYFACKLYGLDLQHTDDYNVFGMVVRLYEKLVEIGLIRFSLEDFLTSAFRRSAIERSANDEIKHMDIMRLMLAAIQNMKVLDTPLNLGNADRDYVNLILKENGKS